MPLSLLLPITSPSTYVDTRTGEHVLVLSGGTRVESLGDFDVLEAWHAFPKAWNARDAFTAWLRPFFGYDLEDLRWCQDCGDVFHVDYVTRLASGDYVCDDTCRDAYYSCDECGDVIHGDDMRVRPGWGDDTYCESCYDDRFTYCERCGEDVYADDHEHEHQGCTCTHARTRFTAAGFTNDTRETVTLPSGEIDDQGLFRIADLFTNPWSFIGPETAWEHYARTVLDSGTLGRSWMGPRGTWTRRLSSETYKAARADGVSATIPPSVLSRVGDVFAEHSQGADYSCDVSRDYGQGAEAFGHEDSCWFGDGEYAVSLCAFNASEGFGLRTFDTTGYTTGRAWVLPMTDTGHGLAPASSPSQPVAAYVVFNGYGDLSGYVGARIMAQRAGWSYRKLTDGLSLSPCYVNGDTGYLVAPQDVLDDTSSVSSYLSSSSCH